MNSNPQACELCSQEAKTSPININDTFKSSLCEICSNHVFQPSTAPQHHWEALHGAIWSESEAVKILAWGILRQLSQEKSKAIWAQELLDQFSLEPDAADLAQAYFAIALNTTGSDASSASATSSPSATKDSNGTTLNAGDSVSLIKDLEVKGAGFTAKRGTIVKNITLTDDPENIEGKVNGTQIVLKTKFLKKVI